MTLKHIARVQELVGKTIVNLARRAAVHDQSKLESPEVEIFEEFTPKLAASTYGSEEYEAFRQAMKPALDHHYANNPHHPEFAFAAEQWRSVVGYEGLYEVSTMGRVKRLARVVPREGTRGDLNIAEQLLSLQPTPKGYLRVQLLNGGVQKNYMVHRLVAMAFLDNPEDRPEVNHLDGNKTNNVVTNLEWATSSENQLHAYDTGLKEPNVKYFVHCVELDIVTLGTVKMEAALRERGIVRASAAGIYSAMDREGKHLDLTFVGYPISEGSPQSMVRGMSLLDLTEMICDWKAATERHNDGCILRSLEVNQKRFGYSDELKQILLNTVKELGFAA